jgi:hypothetical protein
VSGLLDAEELEPLVVVIVTAGHRGEVVTSAPRERGRPRLTGRPPRAAAAPAIAVTALAATGRGRAALAAAAAPPPPAPPLAGVVAFAGFAGAGFAGAGFAIRLAARTAGGPCRRPHAVGRGQRLVVVALIPRLRRALCRGRRTLVASRPLARSRLGPAPAAAAPAATPASPPGPRFVVRRIARIAPIGGRLGGTVVVAEPLRHGIAAVA